MHRLDTSADEQRALKVSTAGALLLAVLGLGFAAVSKSDAVLLDGIYSLVSFATAFGAARVAVLVEQPSTPTFQFGKAAFEPLINTIRATVILIVLIFAAVGAGVDIAGGGGRIEADIALVYALTAGAIGIAIGLRQRRVALRTSSSILDVDATTWLVDGVISLAVGLAFVVVLVLDALDVHRVQAFVDPVLVLLMVVGLVRAPAMTVATNVGELVQASPSGPLMERVEASVALRSADLCCQERQTKLWRLGRYLYVRVTFLLEPDVDELRVAEIDAIRSAIYDDVRDEAMVVKVDCMFTGRHEWMGRAYEAAHPELHRAEGGSGADSASPRESTDG